MRNGGREPLVSGTLLLGIILWAAAAACLVGCAPLNISSTTHPVITMISQSAKDMVWDPTNHVFYLSVPSTAGSATGNTITVLDPATAKLGPSVATESEPHVLAISGDSTFLYVGLDGSSKVQRFTLPTLTADISYSLGSDPFSGPYYAMDLQVAPGAPRTTAVTLANVGVIPAAQGGVVIFDDATPRPTKLPGYSGSAHLFDSLQWGSDATALYAANNESTGYDFYTMSVNSSAVSLVHDYPSAFSAFGIRIHFDAGTQVVYSDDGHTIVPATGASGGAFEASGIMVPDSTVGKAFFLSASGSQSGSLTIASFNLTNLASISSVTISNVSGKPLRLIRWGASGLAFNTTGGQVFLYSGDLVTGTTTGQ